MVYSLLYTYANFWGRSDCMGTDVLNPQAETWRNQALAPSLPEVYRSLHVPRTAGRLRKLFAFAGPGFLVAVGYMDPGNWATDLAGGSRYNYTLLSVIMLSNLMAVLLQKPRHQTGSRDWPRSRPSLSRPFQPQTLIRILGICRDCHCSLRSRRSDWFGHRAQPAVSHPAPLGCLPHCAGCSGNSLPPAEGL